MKIVLCIVLCNANVGLDFAECLTPLVFVGPDLVPGHGDSLGPQIRSEHGHLRRGHLQIFSRFQDPQ